MVGPKTAKTMVLSIQEIFHKTLSSQIPQDVSKSMIGKYNIFSYFALASLMGIHSCLLLFSAPLWQHCTSLLILGLVT